MATFLYHGTRSLEPLKAIDLTKAKDGFSSSEYGIGFYAALDQAVGMANAGWRGGTAGFVYEFEVAGNFDGYSRGHGQRWISGFEAPDRALVTQLSEAMKKLGVADGKDFAKAGAELLQRFEAGQLEDYTGRNLVKNLQSEFGVPREDKPGAVTSADIFIAAGIDGLRGNGGAYFVFLNPRTLPEPVPHSFEAPDNAHATTVGRALYEVSLMKGADVYGRAQEKPLDPALGREVRKMLAAAVLETLDGSGEACDLVRSARRLLEESGADLPKRLKDQLALAETAAGEAAGITPEQIADRRAADELAAKRPARENGEGFLDYKARLYDWYGRTQPGASEGQRDAFTVSLFETLYRDAQKAYAARTCDALAINNDPAKLERLLRQEVASEDMLGVQHVEYELDTLHSKPGYRSQAAAPAATSPSAQPQPRQS